MYELILVVHVIISCVLVALVLIQQGKGAEVGAAFGSGASQTVFGSQGSGNFMTRFTAVMATLFFATSLSLSYIATQSSKASRALSLPSQIEEAQQSAPVGDVPNLDPAPDTSEVPAQSE